MCSFVYCLNVFCLTIGDTNDAEKLIEKFFITYSLVLSLSLSYLLSVRIKWVARLVFYALFNIYQIPGEIIATKSGKIVVCANVFVLLYTKRSSIKYIYCWQGNERTNTSTSMRMGTRPLQTISLFLSFSCSLVYYSV